MKVTSEVYPNPTVQSVIFQMRFPSLFYIEQKIGDFQKEVLQKFPSSSLTYRKSFQILGNRSIEDNESGSGDTLNTDAKIWQFNRGNEYTLRVLTDSIDITSNIHKTYNNEGSTDKFRDIIEFTVGTFFKIISIPYIERIGLRYIDDCPIPAGDEKEFSSYYKTTIPFSRFPLKTIRIINFGTLVDKGDGYYLIFREALNRQDTPHKFQLDYDAYKTNLTPDKYLETTDKLHTIISEEWDNSITEELRNHMRKPKSKS